jgi:hypothetical protein
VAREWSALEKSAETIAYVVNVARCIALERRVTAAQAAGYQDKATKVVLKTSPRMFLPGIKFSTRLNSRLKHAGMTDFG